jgi:DNA-binding transcriptional MerR regulator
MEQLLTKIGIDTDLLNQEQIHTREQTLEIMGISPKTLWKYENQNLIKGTRFKAKKYYTSNDIIEFVKSQFNLSQTTEWDNVWE